MPTEPPSARALTRRLISRAGNGKTESDAQIPAILAACELACEELSLSLGAPGFNVLLRRALALNAGAHPALNDLRVNSNAQPVFGDVPALVEKHGPEAVAAGLAAALESIFTLLGRLIGDDLVARLVEPDTMAKMHAYEESR